MGLDPEKTSVWLMATVKIAACVVVIFPALDTISVFPLIANTLGNNLCSAAVGASTIKRFARALYVIKDKPFKWRQVNNPSFCDLPPEDRKHLIERASRLITILWRLVAALPPLLGSLVAADLSFSLLLAGVAGVYVAFFAPSLMQLKSVSCSQDPNQQQSSTTHTIFHGWYSSTYFCYPVLVFATFSLGAVVVQIKGAWLEMQN